MIIDQILDRLYICDSDFTEEGLDQNKITHILNVGGVDIQETFGRRYYHEHLLDGKGNASTSFPTILFYMEKVLTSTYSQRLLVCCRAGMSRSAFIILLWLRRMGMSTDEAYKFIKSKRPIVQINLELMEEMV